MINHSPQTLAVIEHLDTLTGGNLRKKNDLSTILELCFIANNPELMNSIIFSGTALWKLFSVLKKQTPQSEGYKQLEHEFALALNELRANLTDAVENADSNTVQRFTDLYLGMTGGIIRNLTDLAYDLAKFKEMQNDQRHTQNT